MFFFFFSLFFVLTAVGVANLSSAQNRLDFITASTNRWFLFLLPRRDFYQSDKMR